MNEKEILKQIHNELPCEETLKLWLQAATDLRNSTILNCTQTAKYLEDAHKAMSKMRELVPQPKLNLNELLNRLTESGWKADIRSTRKGYELAIVSNVSALPGLQKIINDQIVQDLYGYSSSTDPELPIRVNLMY